MLYLLLILGTFISTHALQQETINCEQDIIILTAFIKDNFIVSDEKNKTICFFNYATNNRSNLPIETIQKTLDHAFKYKPNNNIIKKYTVDILQEICPHNPEHYELLCAYIQWQMAHDDIFLNLKSFTPALDDNKLIIRRESLRGIISTQDIVLLKAYVECEPKWKNSFYKEDMLKEEFTHFFDSNSNNESIDKPDGKPEKKEFSIKKNKKCSLS